MNEQPEALRLADALEKQWLADRASSEMRNKAAAELRRLHTANAKLLEAMENIERSTHDAMTAALARASIAKAEGRA